MRFSTTASNMSDATIHNLTVVAALVTFGLIVFAIFFMIPLAIYFTHKRDVRRRRRERAYFTQDAYDYEPVPVTYERREPIDAYFDRTHF